MKIATATMRKGWYLLLLTLSVFFSSPTHAQYLDCNFGTSGIAKQSNTRNLSGWTQAGGKTYVGRYQYNPYRFQYLKFGANGAYEGASHNAAAPGSQPSIRDLVYVGNTLFMIGQTSIGGRDRLLALRFNPTNGAKTGQWTQYAGITHDRISGAVADPNGKILAFGNVIGRGGNHSDQQAYLMRLHTNGSKDKTIFINFHPEGTGYQGPYESFVAAHSTSTHVYAVASIRYGSYGSRPVVMRLDYNSFTRDQNFGTNGLAYLLPSQMSGIGGTSNYFDDMEVMSNGKILVAGTIYKNNTNYPYVIRLNANGTVDTGFGSNGIYVVPSSLLPGSPWEIDVEAQSDQKVLISAEVTGNYQVGSIRLNANGTLDTSYGTNGFNGAQTDTYYRFEGANLHGGSKLLVVGKGGPSSGDDIITLVQFNTSVNAFQCTPPTAVCQDITVNYTGSPITVNGSQVDNGSSGANTPLNFSLNTSNFDCANLGANSVTLTVTDAANLTATCGANITVVDQEGPVAICQDVTVYLDGAGEAILAEAMINNGSYDACLGTPNNGISNLSLNNTQFDCQNMGSNPVTLTVTDLANNTSACMATVTVSDAINPQLTCPANITVNNDLNVCGAQVAYSINTSDNCTGETLSMESGMASGSVFPVGTTLNSYVATDANGNTASCSFTVTVNDVQAPVATCPSDITVNNDPGACGAVVSFSVTSSDVCGGEIITQTAGLPSGSLCPVGVSPQTFVVTDVVGNTASCSFTITVNDTDKPRLFCPPAATQNSYPNRCEAPISFSISSMDNCGVASVVLERGIESGNFFPVGVTTNTYIVTDLAGNTGSCTFDITVSDIYNPEIICPYNMTQANDPGECGANISFSISTSDNCSGETYMQDEGMPSGSLFPVGTTTNTFTATDASGNTASCTFTITINDTTKPSISCPTDFVISNDVGSCSAIFNYVPPTGFDNCTGVNVVQIAGLGSGGTFPTGTTVETYEVRDAAGNTRACSFSITVTDADAPAFNCPTGNVVRNTDLGMCDHLAVGQDLDPFVTDNCLMGSLINDYNNSSSLDGAVFSKGRTTVAWTATDASGNTSTCTYDIRIRDREAPTFDHCPADTTLTIPFAAGGSYHSWAALTATDNCNSPSQLTIMGFPLSGSFFSVGVTTVGWTATDKSNNVMACDFDITVVEEGAPTPNGWTGQTIGTGVNSQTHWDSTTGTLTILSSGGTLGNAGDNLAGIFLPSNDAIIDFRARVTPGGNGYYDKAGIMMRQDLTSGSPNAAMALSGTAIPTMSLRASAGSFPLSTTGTAVSKPYWLRLYRAGGTISGYVSGDGINWSLISTYPNLLSSPLYLSFFATTSGAQGQASFDNITINGNPAKEGLLTQQTSLVLKAYPNPFSEYLFIDVENALPGETYQVRLSNLQGQRVYGYRTGASPSGQIEQRISLESLTAGTYLLEVYSGVQRKTIKVQKY